MKGGGEKCLFTPACLTLAPPQETFPLRDELLSDLSDEDIPAVTAPEPLKPTVISFKPKDDADLFGLGIREEAPAVKDSSEELEGELL